GQRGTRILAVINEINGEKIDVIEWSDDPKKFIANALSPAKVMEIKVMPRNKAQAIIQDEQLSLAIGKEGQNVRLAAKLTGWKIDVRSLSETEAKKGDSAEKTESEEPTQEPVLDEVVPVDVPVKEETKTAEKPKKKPAKKAKKVAEEPAAEEKSE
ncbi:MAG: hypothetical protein Q8N55_03135, partial [bacterium]|nr:hypothetical protein [bacterium]